MTLTRIGRWRDRGKELEQSPPPPYQEEWVDARVSHLILHAVSGSGLNVMQLPMKDDEQITNALASPPTPSRHRRARSTAIPAGRRHNPHLRRLQNNPHTGSLNRSKAAAFIPPSASQPDYAALARPDEDDGDVDDQVRLSGYMRLTSTDAPCGTDGFIL